MDPNKPNGGYLILHHTSGTNADPLADTSHHVFEVVDDWHRHGWNYRSSLGHYMLYHYFIDRAGKVTQARADLERGGATRIRAINETSINIALAGNFDRPPEWDHSYPTKAQIASLKKLVNILIRKYRIPGYRIIPHRKIDIKTCYGKNLDDKWVARLIVEELKIKITLVQRLIGLYLQLYEMLKAKGRQNFGKLNDIDLCK